MKQALEPIPEALLKSAARLIAASGGVSVLTGAGISVESGIQDFRSPGGLWERFDPMDYAHIDSFRENPARVWNMLAEMEGVLGRAKPNPAHLALAELEARGLVRGIITQNVDGLHRAAGSKNVIEFHGSHASMSCLDCGRSFERQEVNLSLKPPRCPCGGPIKPDIIFFGEAIPEQALAEAARLAAECRVMLIVGTSGTVAPASMMPLLALKNRASLIQINKEPTDISKLAQISLLGRAGEILPRILEFIDLG